MSDEEDILKENLLNEESLVEEAETKEAQPALPEEILAKKIKAEKQKKKKKRNRRIIWGIVFVLFVYLMKLGFETGKASLEYGVCKIFLELNISYPTTLHVNELNVLSDGSYRLWFSQVDPFGANRADSFQCYFTPDPETGLPFLSKVKIGQIFVAKEKIEYFNMAVPYIAANPPDLSLPYPLSNNIANLQFDESAFTNIRNLADRLPSF